ALREYGEYKGYTNLRLYECDFSYDDLAFDGKIKDFALNKCTNKFKCLLDFDEFIPLFQRHIWNHICEELEFSKCDGFLIASINLCGDKHHAKDISYKFYLHKDTITNRGIIPAAKKSDGKIYIEFSDTTEPLNKDGDLGIFYPLSKKLEDLRT